MRKMVFPLPADESWGCLLCEMNAGRNTDADVLMVEGEPGQRGVVKIGLCASHAEIIEMIPEDLNEAQRKYRELTDN